MLLYLLCGRRMEGGKEWEPHSLCHEAGSIGHDPETACTEAGQLGGQAGLGRRTGLVPAMGDPGALPPVGGEVRFPIRHMGPNLTRDPEPSVPRAVSFLLTYLLM